MIFGLSSFPISDLNESTDWDIAVRAKTYMLGENLSALGFEPKLIDQDYKDDITTTVWKHPLGIDMVVKTDFDLFRIMWKSMSFDFFGWFIWKSSKYKPDRDQVRVIINSLITQLKLSNQELTL